MALVSGVNWGFVTVAPSVDPAGLVAQVDDYSRAVRVVGPNGLVGITAFGWWCDLAQSSVNYEVGLYDNNAASSVPSTRLFVNNTNAMQTTGGWKEVATNWAIISGTTYWIALQVDDTPAAIRTDYAANSDANTYGVARTSGQTTLLDPFNTAAAYTSINVYAFYVIGVAAGAGGTTHLPTGAISGVSYLTAAGWSVTRYMSGSISGVGTLVNAGMPVTHYATGSISGVAYLTAILTKQANNINIVSNISAAPSHARDGSDGLLVKGGIEAQDGYFTDAGVGQTITFTAQDGRIVTVSRGIIISIS